MATGIDILAVISCVRRPSPPCGRSQLNDCPVVHLPSVIPTQLSRAVSNILVVSLAFVTLRNNLMVLSLRAMLVQFVVLMMIAAFCFAGFLYALWT